METTIGIVGLPNVGKSTFFNALTLNKIEVANYPFATIEPNMGVVNVKDPRLNFLQKIYNSKKVIPNYIKFIDIAGLVKGAHEGKGLGNKFLSHIREVDVICEVVRCFEGKDIIHVEDRINPIDDIEIIHLELVIADLQTVTNSLGKIQRKALNTENKEIIEMFKVLSKAKQILEDGKTLDIFDWTENELNLLKTHNLLTIKKKFFVINVHEKDWNNLNNMTMFTELVNFLNKNKWEYVPMALKFELDISSLNEEEQEFYKVEYDIQSNSVENVINMGYKILGLQTFFTCGPQEIKAWTFEKKMTAKECAGVIHTDIEDNFIKAEVISFEDIQKNQDLKNLKEQGKVKIEGKNYLVKDGDICYFHFKD